MKSGILFYNTQHCGKTSERQVQASNHCRTSYVDDIIMLNMTFCYKKSRLKATSFRGFSDDYQVRECHMEYTLPAIPTILDFAALSIPTKHKLKHAPFRTSNQWPTVYFKFNQPELSKVPFFKQQRNFAKLNKKQTAILLNIKKGEKSKDLLIDSFPLDICM